MIMRNALIKIPILIGEYSSFNNGTYVTFNSHFKNDLLFGHSSNRYFEEGCSYYISTYSFYRQSMFISRNK